MRETLADPAAAYQAANVVATVRLAQAAVRAGVSRFVFASTVKVNGESTAPGRPFHPDDPPAPQDAYARSKLDAERELGRICAGTSLAPIILRLPLVYGPGVAATSSRSKTRSRAGTRCRSARSGTGAACSASATWSTRSTRRSMHRPPPRGVHFVADEESIGVPDLVRAIAAALGVEARLRAVPVPLAPDRRHAVGPPCDGRSPRGVARSRSRDVHRAPPAGSRGTRSRRVSRRRRGGGACGMRSEDGSTRAAIIEALSTLGSEHERTLLRPARRRAAPAADHPPLHEARRRLGADRGRRHEGALHRERRGRRAGVPQGQGPGLAHRRIRNAAARDEHADAARGGGRQAVGTHAGDPAADRPQPARGRPISRGWASGRSRSTATCCRPTAARAARRSPARASRSPTRSRGARRRASSNGDPLQPISSPRCRSASSTACRCSTSTTPRIPAATPT